jgi:hypothetical protein
VLGLIATLWATLIGQSVPDLLRDENAPIKAFRAHLAAWCMNYDQQISSIARQERWGKDGQLPRAMWDSVGNVDFDARLAAISAPALYRPEFASLKQDLAAAGRAAPEIGASSRVIKQAARRMSRKLDGAVKQVVLIDSWPCIDLVQRFGEVADECEHTRLVGHRPHRHLACFTPRVPGDKSI